MMVIRLGLWIPQPSKVRWVLWWTSIDCSIYLNVFALQIQKFAPRFMGYNQQDAQEFLRYLLEGMHEDVNRVTVKLKPIEEDIPDSLRCVMIHFKVCFGLIRIIFTVMRKKPWSLGNVTSGETIRRSWTCLLVNSNRHCNALFAATAALHSTRSGICHFRFRLQERASCPTSSCTSASNCLSRRKYSTGMKNL